MTEREIEKYLVAVRIIQAENEDKMHISRFTIRDIAGWLEVGMEDVKQLLVNCMRLDPKNVIKECLDEMEETGDEESLEFMQDGIEFLYEEYVLYVIGKLPYARWKKLMDTEFEDKEKFGIQDGYIEKAFAKVLKTVIDTMKMILDSYGYHHDIVFKMAKFEIITYEDYKKLTFTI